MGYWQNFSRAYPQAAVRQSARSLTRGRECQASSRARHASWQEPGYSVGENGCACCAPLDDHAVGDAPMESGGGSMEPPRREWRVCLTDTSFRAGCQSHPRQKAAMQAGKCPGRQASGQQPAGRRPAPTLGSTVLRPPCASTAQAVGAARHAPCRGHEPELPALSQGRKPVTAHPTPDHQMCVAHLATPMNGGYAEIRVRPIKALPIWRV